MNNPLSPGFNRTNPLSFPFNSIPNSNNNNPSNTLTSGPPGSEASLDISDFPALGGGGPASSIASAPLLSSYASQAGTGTLTNSMLNGSNALGLPSTAAAALIGLTAREFSSSADDFPALGGFGGEGGMIGSNQNSYPSLSTSGAGIGRTQEQASAVAALQHQQQQNQHRANLLGSMNGTPSQPSSGFGGVQVRNTSGGGFLPDSVDKRNFSGMKPPPGVLPIPSNQQPWTLTPAQPFPSNNNIPLSPNNGNGPLPSIEQQQRQMQQLQIQQQQQQQLQLQLQQQMQQASIRSPPMPSAAALPPPGVALPPNMGSRSVIGAGSVIASTALGGSYGGVLPPHLQAPPSSIGSNFLPPGSSTPITSTTGATGVTSGSIVAQTPVQQVLFSPADRYGLLGLLHIIKTQDPDLSMLALGSDLTTLGLDLGATENLYSTFITPWSDSKQVAQLNIEPEFHLPSCYNVQPPPAGTKIGNFSDETLFFIFYSQPRDAMQEMAAHELYKHNWRYHKDLRLWLTKEAGTEPTQKTQSYERGSYIVFDPSSWERVRKDMLLVFDSLERRGV